MTYRDPTGHSQYENKYDIPLSITMTKDGMDFVQEEEIVPELGNDEVGHVAASSPHGVTFVPYCSDAGVWQIKVVDLYITMDIKIARTFRGESLSQLGMRSVRKHEGIHLDGFRPTFDKINWIVKKTNEALAEVGANGTEAMATDVAKHMQVLSERFLVERTNIEGFRQFWHFDHLQERRLTGTTKTGNLERRGPTYVYQLINDEDLNKSFMSAVQGLLELSDENISALSVGQAIKKVDERAKAIDTKYKNDSLQYLDTIKK